jgi:hypothetical protein
MRSAFALTSNVRAFQKAVDRAQNRGAQEAGIVLTVGEAGYGKTRTVEWWGGEHGAVYVRAKAAYTAHWFFGDVCASLGLKPRWSTPDRFKQVSVALIEKPALIVDEVEHCLRVDKVIESIRDIVDFCEIPVILVGMVDALQRLRAQPQIVSRAAATVLFGPATLADVRAVIDTVSEVKIADDLAAEIHRASGGRMREIMNALAVVERIGKRSGKTVSLADVPNGTALTNNVGATVEELAQGARARRVAQHARAA